MSTIPFSPPRIDDEIIQEVTAALRSGWITTGPRTKRFEQELSAYNGNAATLCLNSATAGLELMLRWFGVKEGDEVILPAYTYSATANVVMHCGAKPVLVDVNASDFNINVTAIRKAITERTKVIMPVDFAGLPCDYDAIMKLVEESDVKAFFRPNGDEQEKLGRIMVLSDAAHSFGALFNGRHTGCCADASVFSFHAVKNLTTAEGGAIALNMPAPFDNQEIYKFLCIFSLHGQNKDALAKMQKGNWRYDIILPGYKCNMTDITAAIGLVELRRYDDDTLIRRRRICESYQRALAPYPWAELPLLSDEHRTGSYHLYPLRIRGIDEGTRDRIMQRIFDADVTVNVHFIPLPMLSYYKQCGYRIEDYPVTSDNYSREISLPVFYDLSEEDTQRVVSAVIDAVQVERGS
jgi:dTDP-4-amino-4,6-dideoxygalactose transaminase